MRQPYQAEDELDQVAGGAITLGSAALGLYLLALTVAHKLILPAPHGDRMALTAALSGLVLLAVALRSRLRPFAARHAHAVIAGIAGVLVANAAAILALTGEPEQTTNFILVQIGLGSIMLSRRWFAGSSAALVVVWHLLAWRAEPDSEWTHFFFAFWAGELVSAIVFVFRRRTQLQLAALVAHDRRMLKAERAAAEDMFRALVEQSLLGIVIIRETRVFGYANPKAAATFGYAPEEMIGLPVAAIAHPDDLPIVERNLRRRLAGEVESQHYSFRARRKSGAYFDIEVYGRRAVFEGESVIMGALVDVTEPKRVADELAEKERVLSTLMSNLPGIAYRCRNDRDWSMEFISEGVANLTGHTADELLTPGGLQFNDLIHPDDRDRVWQEVQTALADDRPFTLIYRIVRRDGEVAWVWEQGRGVKAPQGELMALEGFITDITARMRAERALERSENRLRLALEAGELGIWDIDLATGMVEWTDGFARLFGLPPEPLSGKLTDLQKHVDSVDWQDLERALEAATHAAAPGEMTFRVAVDGEERWLQARGRSLGADGHGRMTGSLQDVTARKHFIETLEAAKAQAEEANRLKSAILANMSHEIRTPMTAILGYAELLTRRLKDTPHEKDLRTIRSGGERLLSLLNNVLDLARIEAGKLALQRQSHPAETALVRATELFQVQAEKKGLTLEVEAAADLWVLGDPHAEEQILTNIIGNALKFTDAGGVRVSLARGPEGTTVRYTVTDTGVGMAEAFMPFVFDEFRQESEGVGRRFEGSGLGLAIAKKLVEALGGRIAVASRKNHGTTVTIDLPAGAGRTPASPPSAPDVDAVADTSGPPILLVEDDEATGELLRSLLGGDRTLVWARTGEEALAAAAHTPFALVLLDIHLRGSAIDGVGVMRRLREQPAYRNVPIYALTAYAMAGDRERFLSQGFDAYLAKPFETAELLRLVAASPGA